ncbi:MAG: hypothetical protein JWM85_3282 [Acidimicrobiaceae bacterium]|nr:hypothetical protein [Acidimicrobiaceae bacterium]
MARHDGLPILVLDVDGVINPYAMDGPVPGAFSDFASHESRGFLLRCSRQMGARLASLPAELVWATTWAESVDVDVAPWCSLPPGLRVAARPPRREPDASSNWKSVQVRDFVVAEGRPFAWVDDDALDVPGPDGLSPREWAADQSLDSLLIAPSPDRGLTPGELDRLEEWLSRHGPTRR